MANHWTVSKRLKLARPELTFQDLADDVQDRILRHVCMNSTMLTPYCLKVAQVCRRWHDFVKSQCTDFYCTDCLLDIDIKNYTSVCRCDEENYHAKNSKPTFTNYGVYRMQSQSQIALQTELLRILRSFRCTLRRVEFEQLSSLALTDEVITNAFRLPFQNLKVFALRERTLFCDLTDAAVDAVTRSAPMLKTVMLSGDWPGVGASATRGFTDKALRFLRTNCVQLESVELSGLCRVTEEGLASLGEISTLEGISLSSMLALTDEVIEAICGGRFSLSCLSIKYSDVLTNRSTRAVCRGRATKESLEKFYLTSCSKVTNDGICEILCNCKQLTQIIVTQSEANPSSQYARKHSGHMLQLRHLWTSTKTRLSCIKKELSCMYNLELVLFLVVKEINPAKSLVILQMPRNRNPLKISMMYKNTPDLYMHIADLFTSFPNLYDLLLGTRYYDERTTVAAIVKVGSLLEQLSIEGASLESLEMIAKGCTNLEELRIRTSLDNRSCRVLESITSGRITYM